MSSFFEELMLEIGAPQLYAQLGAPVTRYPLGIIADAVIVTGIWTPGMSELDTKAGRKVVIDGKLQVASSVAVDSSDLWLIDSVAYSAGKWHPLPGGMKEATLKTAKQEYTSPQSGSGKW